MIIEPDSQATGAASTAQPCIAVVDDDQVFRDMITLNLEGAGFRVVSLSSGEEILSWIARGGKANAILLDWRMPGLDGLSILKLLRTQGAEMPVIVLTSLGEPVFEESALAHGAVDFIDKSRSFSIIEKRIALVIEGQRRPDRPTPASDESTTKIGVLELRHQSSRAFWDGHPVNLTLSEFKVVEVIAMKRGSDVSYREIYDAVKGEGFIAGHGTTGYRANVRSLVKRVRQKFKDADPAFDHIENYPGFGYRWVEAVSVNA
jgi:two-component system response regulator ChvI